MKITIRTCISCRKKSEKNNLLRILYIDNKIITDPKGNMPGRGAYVCKNNLCINKLSVKSLNYALKINLNKNTTNFNILRNDDMDF